MQPWYATRDEVKTALDVRETARANAQIDRALENASRDVEALCHRRFYPALDTRTWDWPNGQYAPSWRLWLDDNELISVDTLTVGGQTQDPTSYFLARADGKQEAPYTRLELNLDGPAAFGGGTPAQQQNIAVTGLYGYRNDETQLGATTTALNASQRTVTVDATTSAQVGVGSLLRLDNERVIVTARSQASTGQTLQAALGAKQNENAVTVTDGTAFTVDEVILLDAERMLITDIAGTTLVVERAWDGSALAAHTGSTIYAARTLSLTRGALGTTPTSHSLGTTVQRFDPPGPIKTLTIAEAINTLLQEKAGYARTSKASSGSKSVALETLALGSLREQVYASHGRKARLRGV